MSPARAIGPVARGRGPRGAGPIDRSLWHRSPLSHPRQCCRRPTARKLIGLFEDVQRHTLTSPAGPPVEFTTELTGLQRKALRLLGMSDAYGSWINEGPSRFREIANEMCGT